MKYIFILLTIVSTTLFAQEPALHRTLTWGPSKTLNSIEKDENSISGKYLFFENAVYEDFNTLFPYYNELLNTDNYYTLVKINILNPVFQPVSSDDMENVGMLDELPSDIIINTSKAFNQKKVQIFLSILPLRRNPETGLVERLVSFSIELIHEPQPIKKSTDQSFSVSQFANESVLASGDWYKIKISKTGIYKLTYSELVNIGISNPENVRVYGNGGKAVPLMNRNSRTDDLKENAIYMDKGSDGIFNQGDYILFYAQGTVSWNYNTADSMFLHTLNDYSLHACYFLTSSFGPGKKISSKTDVTEPASIAVTSFNDYSFMEKNIFNLIRTGRQWVGERFEFSTTIDTTFRFPNLVNTSPVLLKANVVSRSSTQRTFTFNINNQFNSSINIGSVNLLDGVGTFARQNHKIMKFNNQNDDIRVKITYNKSEPSDDGWFDYLTLNARRNLILSEKPMFFRDIESVHPDNIAEFRVQNANAQTIVWDVTDIFNVQNINTSSYTQGVSFKAKTDILRKYAAFDNNVTFLKPIIEQNTLRVENQNLHGLGSHKMIIVTHPLFLNQAERLANYRRHKDNFSVYLTTTDKIYNEFSSGMPDISAIRDFARMIYSRSQPGENEFKYLLLVGDGSYNNISTAAGNPNFVPTYQSLNSLAHTSSYVSDDFFGLLDQNEGGNDSMQYYILDIGVGRLPVSDTIEAGAVINKIITYNTSLTMQDWRNTMLFVGDDEDGNLHMEQANSLADYIRTNHPEFMVKKILLDAYKQVTSSNGSRYPDVNKAIQDNFNKGILIFNYSGHGSENGITEEQILIKQDLDKLKNKGRYPLFITATCQFSRWDNMEINKDDGKFTEKTSAGEVVLLNPGGGAIALFSTTRVVYANLNHYLNQHFFYNAFKHDANGNRLRLGDIIRLAKNAVGADFNKLNFTLLGDPALDLAYPEYKIITDSVNGSDASLVTDTIKAFSKVTVSGHIVNNNNELFEDFNGTLIPSVFDKVQTFSTLLNDPGSRPMTFNAQENLIFRGKAGVTNGKFEFSFIVPKDISYTIGNGKISYYAHTDSIDAHGYYNEFLIGGTSLVQNEDFSGPEVEVYLNDENFRDGGISDKDPILYVKVYDENGINTAGNGIGHDIVAVLNDNTNNPLVLNDFYQTQINEFRYGEVVYQMNDIEPGLHTLKVKVWDIFNNSSEKTITFRVIDSRELVLENVYNYPNPFTDLTYFQFEHNMPDNELNIKIEIFDFSGRLIRSMNIKLYASGYRSEPVEWDGKDFFGNKLPAGIYPYRISVTSSNGKYAEQFEKLMILNY